MKQKFLILACLFTAISFSVHAQVDPCRYIPEALLQVDDMIVDGQLARALQVLNGILADPDVKNCDNLKYVKRKKAEVEEKIRQQSSSSPVSASQPRTYTVNGVSFKMIAVEGGTFNMGSNSGDSDEKPVHRVSLNGYGIGETEVTQALWRAVMGSNPSSFKGDNLPVESVSWDDCQVFIRKLNEMTAGQRPAGREFRLPTEAEWEFAAKGGNKSNHTEYAGSSTLGNVAWYYENSGDRTLDANNWNYDKLSKNNCRTHPVAQKARNELGLYDMSGNVWEWCQDWYDKNYYSKSPSSNPCNNTKASFRVSRGGGWGNNALSCRSWFRDGGVPDYRNNSLGLRLAL